MKFIFLAIFLFSTIIHIKYVAKDDENIKNSTKPLLISSLALFYITAVPEIGFISIVIFLGLLACCAGDIFLMLENVMDKGFLYGMIAFAVGHILYILAVLLVLDFSWSIQKAFLLIPAGVIVLKSFPKYNRKLKDMRFPVYGYMVIVLMLHVFVVFGINEISPSTLLLYVGSLFFIFSDSLLAMVDFGKVAVDNARLYIMQSYILAQFLIAIGMLYY